MKILIIEGMFNQPFIETQLIQPMKQKYPGAFASISMGWSDQIDTFHTEADIIIGHSLGGHRAIQIAQTLPNLKHLITLDPRWMSNWGWTDIMFRWQQNFKAPIANTYNFTHTPATIFPGYSVDGADNQELRCNHFNICAQPEVFTCLERMSAEAQT